jgi:hypothetical protein
VSRACPCIPLLSFVIVWPDDTPVLLDVVAIAKSGMIKYRPEGHFYYDE